jgi:hypothetical protein
VNNVWRNPYFSTTGEHDRRALYVSTEAGLYAPYQGELRTAKLVRVDVDAAGDSFWQVSLFGNE